MSNGPKVAQTGAKALYARLCAQAAAGKAFAEIGSESLPYRRLVERIRQLSAWFAARSLRHGDRILIVTRHDEHAMTLFLGAMLNGLCPILLTSDTRSDRARGILRKARPAHSFFDKELSSEWTWAAGEAVTDIVACAGGNALLGRLLGRRNSAEDNTYPTLLAVQPAEEPRFSAGEEDLAFISFTSGTTSAPKGVLTTHRNLFSHLETLGRVFDYSAESRIFNNLVLAHNDGLVQGPLLAANLGATLLRPERFDVRNLESLLSVIVNERVSHFITVPTVLSLIDRFARDDDYFRSSHFQHLISVAAALDPNLWRRLEARLGVRVCNVYGLTETVAGGLFCGPHDDMHMIGTVGRPVDMEVRIVDPQGGRLVEPGAEGELQLRGHNVTPGYFEDADATAALFHEGWMCTGDIGLVQPDGRYQIRGRKKAIIMTGGFNIHPDEINEALRKHPGVVDAVTIPLEDADWGELACSVVECGPQSLTEVELVAHCRNHLEAMKVPKRILLIGQLPRGDSGKVQLPAVREWVLGQLESRNAGMTAICSMAAVIRVAEETFRLAAGTIQQNSGPDDVSGWDSLGHLVLMAAVESAFGIRLSLEQMLAVDSIAALHHAANVQMQENAG